MPEKPGPVAYRRQKSALQPLLKPMDKIATVRLARWEPPTWLVRLNDRQGRLGRLKTGMVRVVGLRQRRISSAGTLNVTAGCKNPVDMVTIDLYGPHLAVDRP